jgi:DNA-binding response OmpR family regulator
MRSARAAIICAYDVAVLASAAGRGYGLGLGVCFQSSQSRCTHASTVLAGRGVALMETNAPGILIVDDNEDNRYMLQLLLETDGHSRIATPSGGLEALAMLEKEKYSLVLLDMMMPDLNGDEVLKVIKGNPDTRDVSVVVLSADTDTERVAKCIEIGADDYLPKPFNPTILRARVSSELRKRSLRALESEYFEKIEQEKKHSEALLRNILPPEIAVRLRKGETNIADHFEDATINFTDIVGFTRITARMKPFEIVACLNRLFSEFDRLAHDVGGEKIKTIGDAYMAAVGLPTPRRNHAKVATALALEFVAAAAPAVEPTGAVSDPRRRPLRASHGRRGRHAEIRLRRLGRHGEHRLAYRIRRPVEPGAHLGGDRQGLEKDFKLDGPHQIETKEKRLIEAFFVSR